MTSPRILGAALLCAGLAACSSMPRLPSLVGSADREDPPLPAYAGLVTLQERYLTVRVEEDNTDSVATWHGPGGEHWLLATAKETDHLLVFQASNGTLLRKVGASGSEPGQLERPNGVAVIDNLAFVVERDNARVQVFSLPDFQPLLQFGNGEEQPLVKPYGLWIQPMSGGSYHVYVTDNYETEDEQIPADSELGRRVKQYAVSQSAVGWAARPIRAFGETSGPGRLKVVESIWGDPETGRLMVADEEEYTERRIKVYGFNARYAGRTMGAGVFRAQPEGLALYRCAGDRGYWIATDQSHNGNYFHFFDRQTLDYQGSFQGAVTSNTDGIWLTQTAFPGFPGGAFFAVHDDGNVGAFDLNEIVSRLGLQACGR